MNEFKMFSSQVRAARGFLGWSQGDLATASGVSKNVIARLETGETDARLSSVEKIQRALRKAGIEFFFDGKFKFGVLYESDVRHPWFTDG